jgi:hypothetical protein
VHDEQRRRLGVVELALSIAWPSSLTEMVLCAPAHVDAMSIAWAPAVMLLSVRSAIAVGNE